MNILNKGKPRHKHMNPRRQWRKLLTALTVSISMAVAPAAMADMNGYDISNWQCGIDTATVPADFVIVGTTWGSGGVYGGCLSNGVNTDANRQLAGAINSGKETGIYHYARGGNPETEARFFVDNVRGYIRKSVLILDWEAQDNAAWGDKQWPRRWAREVKRLTGVNPIIYTMDSGYWQVAGMETELNCGIWIAQYATNMVTGYQTAPWNIGARGEVMRQYTSNGSLSGWSGRLDLNKFRGDRAAWRKYANPDDKGAASLPNVRPTPQPTTRMLWLPCASSWVPPTAPMLLLAPSAATSATIRPAGRRWVAITRRSCRSSTVASAEVPAERPPQVRVASWSVPATP